MRDLIEQSCIVPSQGTFVPSVFTPVEGDDGKSIVTQTAASL